MARAGPLPRWRGTTRAERASKVLAQTQPLASESLSDRPSVSEVPMILRRAVPSLLALVCAAPLALAMSSGPSAPPTPPPNQLPTGSDMEQSRPGPRQEAEESYALAY